MLRLGFDPTTPAFERAKTIHVLDHVATVIDHSHKVTNSVALVRERTIPTERPTFEDRGCHVVSETDPYRLILGFLDRGR
jgi:hypothetical protein